MENKIDRMKELIRVLTEASKMYYVYSSPIMTDYEYDKLYDELVNLENETGMILSDSPTQNVEYEISDELQKVEHPEPMLSLSKTKSVDDLISFIGDKEGLLSWKLDGLTIVLTYDNGKLIRGVTRGNGHVGELITENVKRFKNIPLTIPYKGELVVRGEAIIKYSDFMKMNEEVGDDDLQYKNPRNLCSGSVRQLDSRITAKRNVNLIVFALISAGDLKFTFKDEQFKWLKEQGFTVVDYVKVNANNMMDEVLNYKDKIRNYDIPSDGLVLSYDDIDYGISLGMTAKFPKHSIAFKWKDETVETIIRNVDWMTSRTGLINPVAVFDPIEIEGTVVSRASLHNVSILKSLKIGIGDRVNVFKANMIIPQIASNDTCSDTLIIPDKCPECGEVAKIIAENSTQYLYCTNPYCVAKLIKKLSLYVSRNALNIDGISDQILKQLIKENMVHEFIDLYHLDNFKSEIIGLPGFGLKSYNNLIDSVNKSRNTKLANFIYGLGIPEVGLSRAKLIVNSFNNDLDKIVNLTYDELNGISGIGDVIAYEFVNAFHNDDFRNNVLELAKELSFGEEIKDSNSLSDLTFVITGSLNNFDNRDELVLFIENNGGKVVKAISNNVNYLINNDVTSSSTKNTKAKELGINIISENELLEMVKKC